MIAVLALDASADTTVSPGAITMEQEMQAPITPRDAVESPSADDASASRRGGTEREYVIAPLPAHDPQQGWTLTVPAFAIYTPRGAVAGERASMSGLLGFYSENESWGVGGFHCMSTGGDTWRLLGGAVHAEINYDFFGIGGAGNGPSVPLDQKLDAVRIETLRRIAPNLYAGLRVNYADTNVRLDIPADALPPGIDFPELNANFRLVNLVPRIEYDSRDNEFYPVDGLFAEVNISLSRKSLGSDADFEKYDAKLNHYRQYGPAGVLAARVDLQYAAGDAPFFVVPAFGSGVDLRGYVAGAYRDKFLFAGQVEYRHRFTPRIGAVAFAGIGTVAPKFGQWDKTLPSVGAGFRYVIAPRNSLGLRIDVAWGGDDSQFYVGIGEAF
jgi:hypothetical protein